MKHLNFHLIVFLPLLCIASSCANSASSSATVENDLTLGVCHLFVHGINEDGSLILYSDFDKTATNYAQALSKNQFLALPYDESKALPCNVYYLTEPTVFNSATRDLIYHDADGKVLKNPSFSVGQVLYCEHNTRFYRYTYPSQIYATYLEILAE